MPQHTRLTAALCGLAAIAPNALAQLDDPIPETIEKSDIRIGLQLVADSLTAPIQVTTAPDGSGRLFIVDQAGQVLIIDDGTLLDEPFLDVSGSLVTLGVFGSQDPFSDFDERGLLGLAFHPDFANERLPGFGKLYTYTSEPAEGDPDFLTADPDAKGFEADHHSVVAEWSVDPEDPNTVDPDSERVLFTVQQPQFNHNAGQIEFGPDGLLYIALGDGGGADDEDGQPFMNGAVQGHGPDGNAQTITTILGSIARIDPLGSNSANGQYGIPDDNPFVGEKGVDEIFAWGFRNPFRFSFDTKTGDLIVADVGQNDIEEIDIVNNGENHGWRLKEGSFKFQPNGADDGTVTDDLSGLPDDLVDPVAEYDHDEGLAVVGGFLYRGEDVPELEGEYVFGDFSTVFTSPLGRLFHADLSTGEILELRIGLQDAPLNLFVKGFGRDDQGELFLLAGPNLGPFGNFASIFKIVAGCPADCNGDGATDITDFTCFQELFQDGNLAADCNEDGVLNILDFPCFQDAFVLGCD